MKNLFFGAGLALAGSAVAAVTSEPEHFTKRPPQSTVEPTQSSIYAAQATAVPQSPVSNVGGKAFDRIIQIWLENTDYNVSRSPCADSLLRFLTLTTILGLGCRPQHAVDRQPGHPAPELLCRYELGHAQCQTQPRSSCERNSC